MILLMLTCWSGLGCVAIKIVNSIAKVCFNKVLRRWLSILIGLCGLACSPFYTSISYMLALKGYIVLNCITSKAGQTAKRTLRIDTVHTELLSNGSLWMAFYMLPSLVAMIFAAHVELMVSSCNELIPILSSYRLQWS